MHFYRKYICEHIANSTPFSLKNYSKFAKSSRNFFLSKLHRHNVVLAGDFNAPNILWENQQITGNISTSELLLEIVDKHDLCQLVREPTRKQLQTQNILDLVLANNRNTSSDIDVIPGISDHDIVRFSINSCCRRKPNVKRKVYIRTQIVFGRSCKSLPKTLTKHVRENPQMINGTSLN